MDTKTPVTNPEQPAEQKSAGSAPHQLFDRAFKRAMRLSSPSVIRFINGAFGTSHPLDAEVEYLSTEHITGSLRQSICDMMLGIGQDKYLTESQIGDDGDMSFRLWNYSYLEGMRNRTTKGHVTEIKLVPAIVIYLEPGPSTPDTLSVKITGMDGTSHTFTYPALKLLDYTVEELEEHGLSILLPFYLLKLRKRVQAAKTEEKRRELAGEMKYLVEKLTAALERGEQNGKLDKSDTQTLIALMGKLYDNLYKGYPEFEEVHEMVDGMLLTAVDEAELRGKALGKTEGMALGKTEGIALGEARVLNLLKSGKPPEEILKLYGEAAAY
ncbi:MAG: hypothetical protein LBD08_05660 [Treponema sp.]|jgi:hypothetical protein|nr:hypothetical protein [Treponema sp.]